MLGGGREVGKRGPDERRYEPDGQGVTKTVSATFSQTPARAVSRTSTWPLPDAIALAGVATGSMNAHDAATVAATGKSVGSAATETASAARTGRTAAAVAVAVFKVSYVSTTTTPTSGHVGRPPRRARARRRTGRARPGGAPAPSPSPAAAPASDAPGTTRSTSGPKTQSRATTPKTDTTRRSGVETGLSAASCPRTKVGPWGRPGSRTGKTTRVSMRYTTV